MLFCEKRGGIEKSDTYAAEEMSNENNEDSADDIRSRVDVAEWYALPLSVQNGVFPYFLYDVCRWKIIVGVDLPSELGDVVDILMDPLALFCGVC